MKKLLTSVMVLGISISSARGEYSPSMQETQQIQAAGTVLLQIIETKYDADYELLLGLLKWFESRVAEDERKVWILETLIQLTMDKMWMMMDDKMMDKDVDMIDDNDDIGMMNNFQKTDAIKDSRLVQNLIKLENVTDWTTIRWIVFDGMEEWYALNITEPDGTNRVYAEFENLPDAGADNFYEWWIVRMTEWLSVLSTGELTMGGDEKYINDWMSDGNIDDHTFYVLTLEPRDNDPAPADHILEAHVR